jgi:hypothetical protein
MNIWGSFRAVRPVLSSRASTRWGLMVMSVRVVRIIEFDLNGRKLTLDCGSWCPGRDVCGSRRSPNRGRSRQFGVHPGHACLSPFGVFLLDSVGGRRRQTECSPAGLIAVGGVARELE